MDTQAYGEGLGVSASIHGEWKGPRAVTKGKWDLGGSTHRGFRVGCESSLTQRFQYAMLVSRDDTGSLWEQYLV